GGDPRAPRSSDRSRNGKRNRVPQRGHREAAGARRPGARVRACRASPRAARNTAAEQEDVTSGPERVAVSAKTTQTRANLGDQLPRRGTCGRNTYRIRRYHFALDARSDGAAADLAPPGPPVPELVPPTGLPATGGPAARGRPHRRSSTCSLGRQPRLL